MKVMANITFGKSAGTSQKRLRPQFSSNNCYKRKRICGRRHPACRARGRLPRFTEQSSSEPTSGKFQSRGGADWTIACLQLCSEREGRCGSPLPAHGHFQGTDRGTAARDMSGHIYTDICRDRTPSSGERQQAVLEIPYHLSGEIPVGSDEGRRRSSVRG